MSSASGYRANLVLLESSQKPSRGAPAYSLYVNRPLGRRLAAAFAVTSMTPNGVSFVSFGFSGAALALVAFAPTVAPWAVTITALLIAGYAIDSADGQLARLRGGGSPAGEWLDHSLDCLKLSALHMAVLVSVLRDPASAPSWSRWSAIVFELVAVCSFFGLVLTDLLRREGSLAVQSRPTTWWFRAAGLPTDYGIQCLWFLTWWHRDLFFVGYSLLAAAGLAHLALASIVRFRSLSAVGGVS